MIELTNITVNQYLGLEDRSEYDFVMKYAFKFVDPINEYNVIEIAEMPFGVIKDFQYDLEQGLSFLKLLEYIQTVTKLKKMVANEPLDKICRFGHFLIKGIEQITETEKITLAHEPDPIEEGAGMDRFNGLGVYMQIRSLTNGDVTKYDQVRALPYSLCFTELYTSKQLSDYQKAINEIMKHKHE